jgi:hypothetical protein
VGGKRQGRPLQEPDRRRLYLPALSTIRTTILPSPRIGGVELQQRLRVLLSETKQEATMGFGRGALLWLLGVPLPIIIILALFWH